MEYPGLPKISKMEGLEVIVNNFYPLTIVVKLSTLDVCGSRGYISVLHSRERHSCETQHV